MAGHTLRALVRYDRVMPRVNARWDKVGSAAGIAAAEAAARRELMLVQLAYYRDTYKINTLDNCLRADVEFMRRIANLPKP